MEHLLFLVHRIPYPPNKGDKIRSWHLLRHLAQRYRVHLGTFIDDPADRQYIDTVRQCCGQTHFAELNPRIARVRSLGALAANRPLTLDYYRDAGLRDWVGRLMKEEPVAKILVFSSAMAQYATEFPQARRIIDFVDIDSDKWRQYADSKLWPMSWLYRREGRQLLRYERQVASAFDASLFVSPAEAALFRKLAPESASKTGFFNNGVDTEYFSPERAYANPYAADEAAIVFTGAMDYWPNVDAVQWFAREAMPAILANDSRAVFYIVGTRPSAQVRALAALPGVRVTGAVPDVRPYLAHARVAVAPLRIARGIQNKVLEAMAMAKQVVVSPQALEGIDAQSGRDLVQADNAQQFAAAVSAALARPDNVMGGVARNKVESEYSWGSSLARVDALLDSDARGSDEVAQLEEGVCL
ncbi:TIGR03087 family PEP-CTERM/XrtA system glycosyltransferase [Noviherbaspirillum cavernae]|uniref:TIGR03087 family PEP-CTERM/XrtA system glycosyltransferase n=1 Tax=Noviherbaspirillum cavernae TaxID=2320862 RepID=A0A418X3L3_9BURK|nr:TIGR03087 family PEP-CTERM/XrtA system glycosyltransferase [Noviherbaspirillum cavernae]RJG07048.1 TIGR03087 family PEP-CTERM/XrtA system glycosyltransferase [Noviherbaspirillum cavernae]